MRKCYGPFKSVDDLRAIKGIAKTHGKNAQMPDRRQAGAPAQENSRRVNAHILHVEAGFALSLIS